MPDNLISSPFLYNLSLTLIHFIWQGFFVALVLKLALSVTSYKKPQWRYAFSSLAMIANLLLPLITFFIIYQPDFQQYSPLINSSIFLSDSINNNVQNSAVWYANIVEFLPYLSLTWITITFVLAVKLFIELYNVNQLPKTGTSPADAALEARFYQLAQQVKLKCSPRILVSLKNDVPMAIGWIKPVVLIPVSMLSGLTPSQLDMLILHELAHIRRHDYLVNFIQTLVEIFLFFHPGVRWVSKQMRNEREYCSDDIAVQHSGNPIAYAHTLADTATLCAKHRHHSIPAMAMAASGGDLKQRVVRLIDQTQHCSTTNNSGKWLASIAIIFSIVAIGSKKYIQLPVFDISSGTISLYRNSNDSFNNYSNPNDEMSLPALAKQLLHRNEPKTVTDNRAPIITSKSASDNGSTKYNVQEKLPILESNLTEKATVEDVLTININDRILPSAKTIQSKTNQNIISTEKSTIIVAEQSEVRYSQPEPEALGNIATYNDSTTTIENSLSEPVLVNNVIAEKSMSEQAFERTDSTLNNSVLNNPYATQVANLTNELLAQSSPLSIERNNNDNNFEHALSVSNEQINTYKPNRLPAHLLSSVSPKYPSNAKRKGIEIDIQVTFTIDKYGLVRDIQYYGKGKVSYFRSAIRSALEKWRFTPAANNDQPIESTMTKIFSFSLEK